MAGALFYYEFYSRWNRLRTRLQRLKNPRYLFGALVGGLYFYWYVFGMLRHRPASPGTPSVVNPAVMESVAALALFVVLFLMWVVPHERAALTFSEAEVAFLFPAPVGRRTLIHFKLLKSQTAILLSALFFALIRWGGANFWFRVAAYWGVLSVVNLHLLGSSFARTMLLERGISNWRRRLIVLGATALVLGGIFQWVRQTLPPPPTWTGEEGLSALKDYFLQVTQTGPLAWLLTPFRMATAPFFARDWREFIPAFGGVLAIIALHYLWVIKANVAFEEASVEASRKLAERVAAVRSGNWQGASKPKKAKRAPFQLKPRGWPGAAIFWKNLISAGQLFTSRILIVVIWVTVIAGASMRHLSGGAALAFLAAMFLFMSLLYGPQILRHDFRQDLRLADMLKLLPVPAWQMVLGEILAPAAILAGVQWALLVFDFMFCPARLGHVEITLALRLTGAIGAAAVLPCIDFIALLLPNAAALIFPAWVQFGKNTPRGFETMGQQIILLFGQVIILILTLLPAALAGAAAGFAGWWLFGNAMAAAVAFGAMAVVAVLTAEAAAGVVLLGRAFERFDASEGSTE